MALYRGVEVGKMILTEDDVIEMSYPQIKTHIGTPSPVVKAEIPPVLEVAPPAPEAPSAPAPMKSKPSKAEKMVAKKDEKPASVPPPPDEERDTVPVDITKLGLGHDDKDR